MWRKLFFAIFCFFLACLTGWSQEVAGSVEGRIIDPEGWPLPDADIIIEGSQLIGLRKTVSDSRGNFRVFALPVGEYGLKIIHPAHQETTLVEVQVRLGKTTSLGDIRLAAKVQEAHEVVVTAKKPVIDPLSTEAGGNLSPREYETLPVDRNYRSLAELLPHTNVSYYGDESNIAGATGLENKYYIDGTDVTDPFRGVSGVDLPYNFVREIELRSGGYQAEYGSSLGGILNVITYSGGNTFSGQVFGYLANNRFTAEPRQSALEPSRGDFSQYDIGFSLGGPVVRDKIWFFGSYNPMFEREDVEIPALGYYQDKSIGHSFAGKLTWQVNPKNNVVLSILGDPSKRDAVGETFITVGTPRGLLNPDPYLQQVERGGVYFSLRGTHILSQVFFLETALSRGKAKEKNVPLTERGREEVAFIDNMTGFWSGGGFSSIDVDSVRTLGMLKATLSLPRHAIKSGIAFTDNTLEGYVEGKFLSRFSPFSYLDYYTLVEARVRNRTWGIFLQDSWQPSQNLRLNLGLRWEAQYLYDSQGEMSQSITDQFQPRLGFVWMTKKDGSQRLFGSYGRFYHDISTWFSLQHMVIGTIFESNYYDHDPRIDPSGGMTFIEVGKKSPHVDGLVGQHFDEFTLGYEVQFLDALKAGVRGIYRELREGIEDAEDPVTSRIVYGNPGRGALKDYPRMHRTYTALELTLGNFTPGPFRFFSSYVYSRNEGNYPGLFDADRDQRRPNADFFFNKLDAILDYLPEFEGLLPNDRAHVFKFSGSYRFVFGLSAGAFIVWQSGTPLSEFGGLYPVEPWRILLAQRGSSGRTPAIFDLNLRLTYDFARLFPRLPGTRLILDVFHVGSKRSPVNYDQVHYFNRDPSGNQINPNPNYGLATRFLPPMSLRLGIELGF